jgi:hypothetical protein
VKLTLPAAALTVAVLAGCGGGSAHTQPSGLLKPANLQRKVIKILNNPTGPNGDLGATSARCLLDSGTTFTCDVGYSDGSSGALTITVSPNGKTLVGH